MRTNNCKISKCLEHETQSCKFAHQFETHSQAKLLWHVLLENDGEMMIQNMISETFFCLFKGAVSRLSGLFRPFFTFTGKIRVLIKQMSPHRYIKRYKQKTLTNFEKTQLQSRLFFLEFGHPVPYSVLAQLLITSSLAASSYYYVSPYWVSVVLVWSLKHFVTQLL